MPSGKLNSTYVDNLLTTAHQWLENKVLILEPEKYTVIRVNRELDELDVKIPESLLAVYLKLLPIMLAAGQIEHDLFPQNVKTINLEKSDLVFVKANTVKLAITFGSANKAIDYLRRFETQYDLAEGQLVHEACLFQLPENNFWDIPRWQKIINAQSPSNPNDLILRMITRAKEIEKFVEQNHHALLAKNILKKTNVQSEALHAIVNKKEFEPGRIEKTLLKIKKNVQALAEEEILSDKTKIADLLNYFAQVSYKNYFQNPSVADLFTRNQMSEESFDEYLTLTPKDDDHEIPAITIMGEEICEEYANYYITKLPSADPRAAYLGKLTGCCQSLDNINGAYVAKNGICNASEGFYVLCLKAKNAKPSRNDQIVTQCWAWRSINNKIVFDSIEFQINLEKHLPILLDFFTLLAVKLVTQFDVEAVHVGCGAETPSSIGVFTAESCIPIGREKTVDSYDQRLLAAKKYPVANFRMYEQRSKLKKDLFAKFETENEAQQALFAYCDVIVQKNRRDLLPLIYDEAEKCNLSRKTIDAYYEMLEQYNNLYPCSMRIIENFLKEGFSINQFFNNEFNILYREGLKNNWEPTKRYLHLANPIIQQDLLILAVLKADSVNTDISFIESLINLSTNDSPYSKLLINAAQFKMKQLCVWLIDKPVDINEMDSAGLTALYWAVKANDSELVNMLIERNASITQCNKKINSEMFYDACAHGLIVIVEKLITQDIDYTYSVEDNNCLSQAISYKHIDVVKLLIKTNRFKSVDKLDNFDPDIIALLNENNIKYIDWPKGKTGIVEERQAMRLR